MKHVHNKPGSFFYIDFINVNYFIDSRNQSCNFDWTLKKTDFSLINNYDIYAIWRDFKTVYSNAWVKFIYQANLMVKRSPFDGFKIINKIDTRAYHSLYHKQKYNSSLKLPLCLHPSSWFFHQSMNHSQRSRLSQKQNHFQGH